MIYSNNITKSNNYKTFLIIAGFYLVFTLIHIVKNIYTNAEFYSSVNWYDLIIEKSLIQFFIVSSFALFIIFCSKIMIAKKFTWVKSFIIHFILASSLGVILFFGTSFIQILTRPDYQFTFDSFSKDYMNSIDSNFLIYLSIVGVFYAIFHIEKLKLSNNRTEILNDNLTQSKLKVLQSQIQPQFLHSGLNTISSLMQNDILLAQNTTEDLGDYLRSTIKIRDKNFIPVHQEIILTNKYINILRARFNDQLTIKLNYEDAVKNCMMPSMTLQPIIENIMKHGFSKETRSLEIHIDIYKKNKIISIFIQNSRKQIKKNNYDLKSKAFGLINLRQRLELLYNHKFSILNKTHKHGHTTTIKFPCNPEIDMD